MPSKRRNLLAASSAGGDPLYVEDVFSTDLWLGVSATALTVNNGVDLDGEGGMVWVKGRSVATTNCLVDTERLVSASDTQMLHSDTTAAAAAASNEFGAFTSTGYTIPYNTSAGWTNFDGRTNVGWAFRKAENFFTMVEFTADAMFDVIQHDLGSMPGFVIYKCVTSTTDSTAGSWQCWHSSLDNNDSLVLNTTAAEVSSAGYIGDVTSTQCQFYCTVGETYIAYYFGNDQAVFGAGSDESIIKCGTWDENSTNNVTIDCGFEPEFVMFKCAGAASPWYMVDSMRGIPTPSSATATGNYISTVLQANVSTAETSANAISLTSTGFIWYADGRLTNTAKWVYIAVRMPMKTPTAGTEVFQPLSQTPTTNTATGTLCNIGITPDLILYTQQSHVGLPSTYITDRLRGAGNTLKSDATTAEQSFWGTVNVVSFDHSDKFYDNFSYYQGSVTTPMVYECFKRATGFMDVVAYTGDGVAGRTLAHNLGSVPYFMVVKRRNAIDQLYTYHQALGSSTFIPLNSTGAASSWSPSSAIWYSTTPTSTDVTIGADSGVNASGGTYVLYLFATLAGVSKVGSYTGTAADLNVDCGFTAGARFILIKRTDSTGDWYYWDSARGISAGNDPYLLLNSTAAEVTGTDYIDPLSAGFTVTSTAPAGLNANGGSYIFLSIA